MADVWLTVKQIAEELQVNDNTVRDWIKSKELTAFNVGSKLRPDYRIKRTDFDKFITARTV
jgi:excisionase family DNA binding protein